MEQSNNIFSEIINYEDPQQIEVVQPTVQIQSNLDADFDEARDQLKNIAAVAQQGLDDAATLAKQLQHTKGYDSLAKMIGAATMASKALVELHRNRIEGKDGDSQVPAQHTHNTLILTTDELQKKFADIYDQAANSDIK